jgi:hypothetical protein
LDPNQQHRAHQGELQQLLQTIQLLTAVWHFLHLVYHQYQHKTYHIGTFADKVDAAKAYDAQARIYHGVSAHLNFPAKVAKIRKTAKSAKTAKKSTENERPVQLAKATKSVYTDDDDDDDPVDVMESELQRALLVRHTQAKMKQEGWSQGQLGRRIGASQQQISNWMRAWEVGSTLDIKTTKSLKKLIMPRAQCTSNKLGGGSNAHGANIHCGSTTTAGAGSMANNNRDDGAKTPSPLPSLTFLTALSPGNEHNVKGENDITRKTMRVSVVERKCCVEVVTHDDLKVQKVPLLRVKISAPDCEKTDTPTSSAAATLGTNTAISAASADRYPRTRHTIGLAPKCAPAQMQATKCPTVEIQEAAEATTRCMAYQRGTSAATEDAALLLGLFYGGQLYPITPPSSPHRDDHHDDSEQETAGDTEDEPQQEQEPVESGGEEEFAEQVLPSRKRQKNRTATKVILFQKVRCMRHLFSLDQHRAMSTKYGQFPDVCDAAWIEAKIKDGFEPTQKVTVTRTSEHMLHFEPNGDRTWDDIKRWSLKTGQSLAPHRSPAGSDDAISLPQTGGGNVSYEIDPKNAVNGEGVNAMNDKDTSTDYANGESMLDTTVDTVDYNMSSDTDDGDENEDDTKVLVNAYEVPHALVIQSKMNNLSPAGSDDALPLPQTGGGNVSNGIDPKNAVNGEGNNGVDVTKGGNTMNTEGVNAMNGTYTSTDVTNGERISRLTAAARADSPSPATNTECVDATNGERISGLSAAIAEDRLPMAQPKPTRPACGAACSETIVLLHGKQILTADKTVDTVDYNISSVDTQIKIVDTVDTDDSDENEDDTKVLVKAHEIPLRHQADTGYDADENQQTAVTMSDDNKKLLDTCNHEISLSMCNVDGQQEYHEHHDQEVTHVDHVKDTEAHEHSQHAMLPPQLPHHQYQGHLYHHQHGIQSDSPAPSYLTQSSQSPSPMLPYQSRTPSPDCYPLHHQQMQQQQRQQQQQMHVQHMLMHQPHHHQQMVQQPQHQSPPQHARSIHNQQQFPNHQLMRPNHQQFMHLHQPHQQPQHHQQQHHQQHHDHQQQHHQHQHILPSVMLNQPYYQHPYYPHPPALDSVSHARQQHPQHPHHQHLQQQRQEQQKQQQPSLQKQKQKLQQQKCKQKQQQRSTKQQGAVAEGALPKLLLKKETLVLKPSPHTKDEQPHLHRHQPHQHQKASVTKAVTSVSNQATDAASTQELLYIVTARGSAQSPECTERRAKDGGRWGTQWEGTVHMYVGYSSGAA